MERQQSRKLSLSDINFHISRGSSLFDQDDHSGVSSQAASIKDKHHDKSTEEDPLDDLDTLYKEFTTDYHASPIKRKDSRGDRRTKTELVPSAHQTLANLPRPSSGEVIATQFEFPDDYEQPSRSNRMNQSIHGCKIRHRATSVRKVAKTSTSGLGSALGRRKLEKRIK
mmetsp:Transcript_11120/g.12190  ORF Transcript_11120/g.12190 Transcript_11120/m.12190 type:complete len:169 (-) Transcript_11120:432-938(-)